MTREEAIELIERMPFLTTVKAPHKKARIELYKAGAESDDPVEWARVVKSCYVSEHFGGMHAGEEEVEYAAVAREKLEGQIAKALDLGRTEVEAYITGYIAENI